MKNKLVIPIDNILSTEQLSKTMERILIDDEALQELGVDQKTIEREGFSFSIKKTDPKNNATYIEISFSKEIQGWFEHPDNKIGIVQSDSIVIESSRGGRRLMPIEGRKPHIHLKDLPAKIKMGNAELKFSLDLTLLVEVDTDDVIVDLSSCSFHGYAKEQAEK